MGGIRLSLASHEASLDFHPGLSRYISLFYVSKYQTWARRHSVVRHADRQHIRKLIYWCNGRLQRLGFGHTHACSTSRTGIWSDSWAIKISCPMISHILIVFCSYDLISAKLVKARERASSPNRDNRLILGMFKLLCIIWLQDSLALTHRLRPQSAFSAIGRHREISVN